MRTCTVRWTTCRAWTTRGSWNVFSSNYYVLAVGNQDPLFDQNVKLAHVFGSRGIPHVLDVWEGFGHDWPWWYKMAEKFFL